MMARKAKSALPEKFEEFEKQMASVPVAEPKKADAKTIGGMEEGRWSGVPIWRCPQCHSTTFDAATARVHTCKEVRFADDAD